MTMADFPRLWQAKFLWQNQDEERAKAPREFGSAVAVY
jgi:hypothetical protein